MSVFPERSASSLPENTNENSASISPIPLKPASSLYFVNAGVDALLMGGASILAYLGLRAWTDGARTETVYTLAIWLSWVCNWPHFSATNHRLYGSVHHLKQYPMTAAVVPILAIGGGIASFLSPTGFAPAFVKLFLLWSPYHFSGQTLGVSLLYARRAGIALNSLERASLSAFIFGIYYSQTFAVEAGLGTSDYYGIAVPILGVAPVLATLATAVMWIAGGVFAATTILRVWKKESRMPLILFLPALSQYVWFVQGRSWPAFQEFVPFFHSLQYLMIAWAMRLKERALETGAEGSSGFVLRETGRFGAINLIGGAILFHYIPLGLSEITGQSLAFASGIALAAVQIHHFFVDGVIWKLKRNTVVSPLMMNLGEISRRAPAATREKP